MNKFWEWETVQLGDLFHLHRESVRPAKDPTQLFRHYSLPAVDELGGPVEEPGLEIKSTKYLLRKPTILVSKLNPRILRVARFEPGESKLPSCSSTEFMTYSPTIDSVHLGFYEHWFRSVLFQRKLERTATGTTNSHSRVTPSETLRWGVPHPPFKVQRCIAEVLDSVDAAIQQTDAVIAKQQQVKKGLLQDLLTRGLDEEGRLRDPERHPEQFKESPLGRLPKSWTVKTVEDIAESAVDGPFGSKLKTAHYVDSPGVRVVRLQNIGHGVFLDSDKAFVSNEHAATLRRHEVVGADLLVASLGDNSHPVGRACIYPIGAPSAINKADCFRIRIDSLQARPEYVMGLLNCHETRSDIRGLIQGVTRDRINLTNLKQVRLPIAPLQEQGRIVARLVSHQEVANAEIAHREKLQRLKDGLMQDLLTGRVRVPEAEKIVSEVVA